MQNQNQNQNQNQIRIQTRCPACHHNTLTISNNKLLCTWINCSDPTLINDDMVIDKLLMKVAVALIYQKDETSFRLLRKELAEMCEAALENNNK